MAPHDPAYHKDWHCAHARTVTITVEGNRQEIERLIATTPFDYITNLYEVWFADLRNHTLAEGDSYFEFAITIPVTYKGRTAGFTPYMLCNCVPAILAGREVFGYPKQFAHINILSSPIADICVAHKAGIEVVRAAFVPDAKADIDLDAMRQVELANAARLLYKTLPDAVEERPAFSQVIYREMARKVAASTPGRASLSFGEGHPMHRLGIQRILGARLTESSYGGDRSVENRQIL